MPKKIIKKFCLLLLLCVIFPVSFVKAQVDKKLDKKHFNEAIKDAKEIEPNEVEEKLQIIDSTKTSVLVATVTENSCEGYQKSENSKHFSGKDIWITLLSEMKSVFQIKKMANEFGNKENRLKKLLGLKWNRDYRCFVELKVDVIKITRPSSLFDLQGNKLKSITSKIKNKNYDKEYPYTDLGYTCDWYYGDGCRYGLTEFFLKKGNDSIIIKACDIDEKFEENCLSQDLEKAS